MLHMQYLKIHTRYLKSQIVFKTVLSQNEIYLQHIRKYVITDYCTQFLLALSFYLEATHMYLTHVT